MQSSTNYLTPNRMQVAYAHSGPALNTMRQPASAAPSSPASDVADRETGEVFAIFPSRATGVSNKASVAFGALAAMTATLTYTTLGWSARISRAMNSSAPETTLVPILVTGGLIGSVGSALTSALLAGAFSVSHRTTDDRPCGGRLWPAVAAGLVTGAVTGVLVAYSSWEASAFALDEPHFGGPREPWRLTDS